MPRPGLPPTPGSSSDIKGQDGSHHLAALNIALELPPPALHDAARASPTDTTISPTAAQAPYPLQAAETVKARRRSSAATVAHREQPREQQQQAAFALPPPPTRSRKIIQMKPRPQGDDAASGSPEKGAPKATGKAQPAKSASTNASGGGAQGKKKQPSASSAAGRKIARKTAHSLIERRRRSKMNEEFAVLKGMIPACTGEMHKLAILQASIEYVRYLEDCVTKLKAQHDDEDGQGRSGPRNPLPPIRQFHPTFRDDPAADVDMTDSEAVSPTFTAQPDHHQASVSPALQAQDARHRQQSYSSASTTTDNRHYSYSASAGTSPAFGPQRHGGVGYAPSCPSASGSTLTSPALNPQTTDLDQEATAALLMLNSDRRVSAGNGRGLSVRDLLSSS